MLGCFCIGLTEERGGGGGGKGTGDFFCYLSQLFSYLLSKVAAWKTEGILAFGGSKRPIVSLTERTYWYIKIA